MISFDFASEQVSIGGIAVPAILRGEKGKVHLYPPLGPLLRSLSVLEREQCLRNALSSPVPLQTTTLAKEILIRATAQADQREQVSELDRGVFKAIALHLAGADIKAPSFTRAISLLSRELGWSAEDIWSSPAAQFDQIAAGLMPPRSSDWNQLIMAESQHVELEGQIETLVEKMANDLLQRVFVTDEAQDVSLMSSNTSSSDSQTNAQSQTASSQNTSAPHLQYSKPDGLNDSFKLAENNSFKNGLAITGTASPQQFKVQEKTATDANLQSKTEAEVDLEVEGLGQPQAETEKHPLLVKKLSSDEVFSRGESTDPDLEGGLDDFAISSNLTDNVSGFYTAEPRLSQNSNYGGKRSAAELDLEILDNSVNQLADSGVSQLSPDENLLQFPGAKSTATEQKKAEPSLKYAFAREKKSNNQLDSSINANGHLDSIFETEQKSIADELAELLNQEADLRGID